MQIDAGELNKKIQILEIGGQMDRDGYKRPEETLVRAPWAKLTRTSGREIVQANADFAQVQCRFLIRWSAVPLSRKMVVRYAGEDYDILYINDYGDAHKYVELWCRLRTLGG